MIPLLETRLLSCQRGAEGTLDQISLAFAPSSFNLLTGPSLEGKALLLRLLGLLERPDRGELLLDQQPTQLLEEADREALRNQRFGYLFGAPFLLPSLSVLENVAMPLFRISHLEPDEAQPRINELLEFVGLSGRAQEPVEKLSFAEQEKVALARALANRPSLLLIENLDAQLSGPELSDFATLLRRVSHLRQTTVIATADHLPIEAGDRVIEVCAGSIRRDFQSISTP